MVLGVCVSFCFVSMYWLVSGSVSFSVSVGVGVVVLLGLLRLLRHCQKVSIGSHSASGLFHFVWFPVLPVVVALSCKAGGCFLLPCRFHILCMLVCFLCMYTIYMSNEWLPFVLVGCLCVSSVSVWCIDAGAKGVLECAVYPSRSLSETG